MAEEFGSIRNRWNALLGKRSPEQVTDEQMQEMPPQTEATEQQQAVEKRKIRIASLDEGYRYFDENNQAIELSPQERAEVFDAYSRSTVGEPSDKYDFEILDVIDNAPVFPEAAAGAGGAGGGGDGGGEGGGGAGTGGPDDGDDRRRRRDRRGRDGERAGEERGEGRDREPKRMTPKERTPAVKQAKDFLNKSSSRWLSEEQKDDFDDQIELAKTLEDLDRIKAEIKATRDAAAREFKRAAAEETARKQAAEVAAAQLAQQPPEWSGKYFERVGGSRYTANQVDYLKVQPMTIPEILGNQRNSQLWGEFLEALDPGLKEQLMDRISKNQPLIGMNADLQNFVGYAQLEFTRQIKRMESIAQKMKPSDLQRIINGNPALLNSLQMSGKDATTAALMERMFHTAVRDKGAFDTFAGAFERYSDERLTRRGQKAERIIKGSCERMGITEDNYYALVDPNDPAGTEQRFILSVRAGKRSLWQKAMDRTEEVLRLRRLRLPGSSAEKATIEANEVLRAHGLEEKVNIPELQKQMLEGILPTFQSDEFQAALMRKAFVGDRIVPAEEKGPQSKTAMQTEAFTLETMQNQFDRDISIYARSHHREVSSYTEEELRQYRDNEWNPPEARGRSEGQGYWAQIARAFQRAFFAQNKSRVKVNRNQR